MIPEDIAGLRIPPHSAEAEMAVLGSVLLDPMEALAKVNGKHVTPDMFYDRRHQALLKEMQAMVAAGCGMDAITIGQWLSDKHMLEKAGGYDYLGQLQEATLVPAHVEHYADIVIEKHIYRSLIWKASELMDEAYKGEKEAGALLRGVPERFAGLVDERRNLSNQQLLDDWYLRMEKIKNGEIENGLPLPWPMLDALLCGLEPGLILIGARPSCGKTTLEVNICDSLARQGCPVARACLDMSREQLLVRSVIRESRVSLPRLKYGFARWNQVNTVKEVKDVVAKWPHHVIEDNTLDGILSEARMLKMKYDIELLTVDFAQLITSGDGRLDSNMNALMGMVTKKLKALAFELNIPVLLLSQLNRGSDKDDRRPRLSDLRDSGNLEQNATQVILMSKAKDDDYPGYDKEHRPDPLPEEAEKRILRGILIDVAKNQNGEVGEVCMWMRPNYFRFEEAETEWLDLTKRLGDWRRETEADEVCEEGEPCVTEDDVEVDGG